MRVSEAIANAAALLGREVEVVGRFVCNGEVTYVSEEHASSSPPSRIYLPHPAVQDALLDSVPVLVGGPNLYDASCRVAGILSAQAQGSPQLAPTRIELHLSTGKVFEVSVPVKPDKSLEHTRGR